jgi:hypothetical protein
MIHDMTYLSTAIELTPGGSSTIHIYTQIQTIHLHTNTNNTQNTNTNNTQNTNTFNTQNTNTNNTQYNTNNKRRTQITNLEEQLIWKNN